MCTETPNWGPCVNSARLLLAWVLAGLATGIVLHFTGNTAYAAIAWAAASIPVALHVAFGVLRSLLGGRLGVDVIALFSILGALALNEAAAAAVIALMVAGGEALESWAEGRAQGALTDLLARASTMAKSATSRWMPSRPVICCWSALVRPCPPMARWKMPAPRWMKAC